MSKKRIKTLVPRSPHMKEAMAQMKAIGEMLDQIHPKTNPIKPNLQKHDF